jgi:RNA polymerase sigma-70 factor, ECF subfamily
MATTLDVTTRASLLLAAGDPANQDARAAFVECYVAPIRVWCRGKGLQKADQDDVVQEVLTRLLVKILPTFKYDPGRRFRGLLWTVISHTVADLHRERQRHPGGRGSGDSGVFGQLHEVPAPDDPAVEELAQDLARRVERDQQLHEACERVSLRVKPHTWQAFWLATFERELAAKVAQRLGMTQGAVLVAKNRVIRMIREEVKGTAG